MFYEFFFGLENNLYQELFVSFSWREVENSVFSFVDNWKQESNL